MSLTNKLNQLFKEWENSLDDYKEKFVKDGIINETEWRKTNPRILFVAKEPNHKEGAHAGDFRYDWQSDEAFYKFKRSIAEWSYGLINGFPIFSEISGNTERCKEYLQKIAFLNIKKLGGGSVTEDNKFIEFVKQEHQIDYVKEELAIISPDIIILGLSFNEDLRCLIFPELVSMIDCGYGINVAKTGNCKIIDFYHPSSRNTANAAYSLLQNVVNSDVFRRL